MKRASVTEAKNQLSALLDRVRHGETVLIEDRGVPVALISPVSDRTAGRDRAVLARLERQGTVRPPAEAAPSQLALTKPPRPARRVALSRLVAEERGEGW
jgi:prevent-host-death family protein